MYYPQLNTIKKTQETVDKFTGIQHTDACPDSACRLGANVFTHNYPLWEAGYTRPWSCTFGLQWDDAAYLNGKLYFLYQSNLFLESAPFSTTSGSYKWVASAGADDRFVRMGAWLILWPSGVRVNTKTDEIDTLGQKNTASGVSISLCRNDGSSWGDYTVSDTEPTDTTQKWMDTSGDEPVLKEYSTSSKEWESVGTTYLKIAGTGLGKNLAVYDTVTLEGIGEQGGTDFDEDFILYATEDDAITIAGILSSTVTVSGSVTAERKLPELDFVCECNNRLWGCSSADNEIHACKLGDPTNWYNFMGLSSDSYSLTVGAPGQFTGCCAFLGYILFFKEDVLLKMFGTKPTNYQLSQTNCRGVKSGCAGTLCVVNETLYYRSPVDIVRYDGGLPESISTGLGNIPALCAEDSTAFEVNGKYWITLMYNDSIIEDGWGEAEAPWLYVYDPETGLWGGMSGLAKITASDAGRSSVRCVHCDEINGVRGPVFMTAGTACEYVYLLNAENYGEEEIKTIFNDPAGNGIPDAYYDLARYPAASWCAVSGMLGREEPDAKYLSRIQLRLWLAKGASLKAELQYDDGEWEEAASIDSTFTEEAELNRSVLLPILVKRCDHVRLRLSGQGPCKIYRMRKEYKVGAEVKL